jgi:hypothetical protein
MPPSGQGLSSVLLVLLSIAIYSLTCITLFVFGDLSAQRFAVNMLWAAPLVLGGFAGLLVMDRAKAPAGMSVTQSG